MRILNADKRSAFSLLEMVIALALGMVLLLALYVTLNITVNLAQSGREVMADGSVARSIMSRINNDICNQVGPVDPRVLPDYSLTNPTSVGGIPVSNVLGSANAMTANGTSMTPATPSGSSPSAGSGSTSSSATPLTSVLYNVGVRGDATSLILSVYRVQRPPVGQPTDVPDPIIRSDVTRINYWLIPNGADALGLARQEIKQATSADIDLALTDISNPNQYLISDEVKNVLFEYYDGTTWLPQWDGHAMGGPASDTRIGPPAAIRVTLTLRRNTKKTETVSDNPDDATNTYVHVIALPTSNNPAPRIATSN